MYSEYIGKHSWTVRITRKMINFYFFGKRWMTEHSYKVKVQHLWFQRVKFTVLTPSGVVFTIFMNGLYSFKANSTLLSTLSGHLLFFLHICISKQCFKQNLILQPFFTWICWRKKANLLPECDLQSYMCLKALC